MMEDVNLEQPNLVEALLAESDGEPATIRQAQRDQRDDETPDGRPVRSPVPDPM
jgi:hypothetical protein